MLEFTKLIRKQWLAECERNETKFKKMRRSCQGNSTANIFKEYSNENQENCILSSEGVIVNDEA